MDKKIKNLQVFSKKLNGPLTVAATTTDNVKLFWNNASWGNTWSNWKNGWSKNVWANTFQWLNGWGNNGSSGGGCYITTACVEHAGLKDDCDELNTLRFFRDELVKTDSEFREKVLEYYEKAPHIVDKINESANKDTLLDDLYVNMVQPCIWLLKQGQIEDAKELYLSYYEELVEEYLN